MSRRWLLAAAMVTALAGCASDPTRTALGESRAEVLQRVGTPTATYPLPDGGERLQYSRAPLGFEVSNIDVNASGQVVSVRQELFEGLFGSTIKPGVWREADVLRTYGRPYEITRVTSFDGNVWSWRFKHINQRRLLYVYVSPDGVVDHYNTGDELMREFIGR